MRLKPCPPRAGSPARPALNALLAALACALPMSAALAAEPATDKALAASVQKLLERVQQLELRNQALERRVQDLNKASPAVAAASAPPPAPASGSAAAAGMAADSRLQQQVLSLARHAEPAEEVADAGLQVEGGVVAVAQRVNAGGGAEGRSEGRINYRGDVLFTLPAGSVGNARGTAVAQLRFGQGGGVALRPTHTGAVNSTAFEAGAGSEETYAIVAQVYYQLDWALDGGRFNDQPGNRVELTVGKLDLFGFFDQNAVAGDEGAQFLNNAFVHNPLLDSGGDIGADAYGFAPGMRLGYFKEGETLGWGASLGVFSSGAGSGFNASPGRPLVIAQFQMSPKQINGEARGNYRVYAWTNGHTTDLDGIEQRHTGFGVSADQRIGRVWNLFGR